MPGWSLTLETRVGTDVKTRSSVFIDAGRVGSATCCLRAWSSIRSNNLFIRGGVRVCDFWRIGFLANITTIKVSSNSDNWAFFLVLVIHLMH